MIARSKPYVAKLDDLATAACALEDVAQTA